jgi:hypothetical protein
MTSSTFNVLLMNAVQATWKADTTSDPAVANILFLPTWYTDTSDITMAFRHVDETRPQLEHTTDGRYESVYDMVDIHLWVRSAGGDAEPTDLAKMINGLKTILHKNKATLITNCICQVTAILPGRLEIEDDRQTLWHRIIRVQVKHYEVSTV